MADELHFVSYDPEELWKTAQYAYVQAGGDILYPGDEKEILMRSFVAIMVQILAAADNGLKMADLQFAIGEYLDLRGKERNCARIEATAATGMVIISFAATGIAQTIPAGTAMTPDGVRFYETTADIAQTGYAQQVAAQIQCTEAGARGNGPAAGTEMQLAKSNAAVKSIIVATAIGGGTDREDDDEAYRERIEQAGLTSVTTGPTDSYESIAMGASSQILDARTVNDGPGRVCTYLLLQEGADADALCAAVVAAQSPKDKRPATDSVRAAIAEVYSYSLQVRYTIPDSASAAVAQAVAQAAAQYHSEQDSQLGAAFNPDKLRAMMYDAGASRVVFGEDSHFNGGAVEYTAVPEYAHCKGEISLSQEIAV